MPDATELELIAQELSAAQEIGAGAVIETTFFRERASIEIAPRAIRPTLAKLRERGYAFLSSVHGVDYFPHEPRLGVHYEMLDMANVDRLTVKARLSTEDPHLDSVANEWPTANHQEREVYDMFGVVFDGHPDLRRILMPEDYEGHPRRRDFPIGGEPVFFTFNDPAEHPAAEQPASTGPSQ